MSYERNSKGGALIGVVIGDMCFCLNRVMPVIGNLLVCWFSFNGEGGHLQVGLSTKPDYTSDARHC